MRKNYCTSVKKNTLRWAGSSPCKSSQVQELKGALGYVFCSHTVVHTIGNISLLSSLQGLCFWITHYLSPLFSRAFRPSWLSERSPASNSSTVHNRIETSISRSPLSATLHTLKSLWNLSFYFNQRPPLCMCQLAQIFLLWQQKPFPLRTAALASGPLRYAFFESMFVTYANFSFHSLLS